MKILLTGATGFIGSACARLALTQGHEVAGLILPWETPATDLAAHVSFRCLKGTLEDAPWKEIGAFGAETCLHTAWITTPGVYLESQENDKHLQWSLDFLRQMIASGTRHITALGTCIEYQAGHPVMTEDTTPVVPTTRYARCKNELRLTLESEAKSGHYSFCWGRVFYPYGPGEHPSRLCSFIIHKLRQNETILLKTPASTKDYIFISDLAAAILKVIEQRFRGCINLGTGVGTTVLEMAQTVAQLLNKPALVQTANPPLPDPAGDLIADAHKLQALGWSAQVTLREGLMRLIQQAATGAE